MIKMADRGDSIEQTDLDLNSEIPEEWDRVSAGPTCELRLPT